MNRFLMSYNNIFPSYLIVTLWALQFLPHMNRFMMSYKFTFLSCLIFKLWTLKNKFKKFNTRSNQSGAQILIIIYYITSSQVQTLQNAPQKSDIKSKSEKRVPNPYEIRIHFLPDENFKEKFRAINRNGNPFLDNLIPDPQGKRCKVHKNKFCSKQSALTRYLVVAEKVNIHSMFNVEVYRVFYLDTLQDGGDDPLCGCRLPYTGETDHILPISKT